MENVQALTIRVEDGLYEAIIHWRLNHNGTVELEQNGEWTPVDVPVRFVPDYLPIKEED